MSEDVHVVFFSPGTLSAFSIKQSFVGKAHEQWEGVKVKTQSRSFPLKYGTRDSEKTSAPVVFHLGDTSVCISAPFYISPGAETITSSTLSGIE